MRWSWAALRRVNQHRAHDNSGVSQAVCIVRRECQVVSPWCADGSVVKMVLIGGVVVVRRKERGVPKVTNLHRCDFGPKLRLRNTPLPSFQHAL